MSLKRTTVASRIVQGNPPSARRALFTDAPSTKEALGQAAGGDKARVNRCTSLNRL